MKSGDLRNRISIQAQSSVQDDTGQMLTTWSDVALVWASIRFISGMSAIQAGMDASSVKASIRIRYRAGIHAGMRVLHGDTVYQIEGVMPEGRKDFIDLVVKATNAET